MNKFLKSDADKIIHDAILITEESNVEVGQTLATGDDTPLMVMILLLLSSGICIFGLKLGRLKRNEK